jgi:pimeloyl-ACP methyl ester carboxylesterase
MTHPPLLRLGGSGLPIQLALANGITPETYLGMLRPVMETHEVVCLPPRAMWPAEPVPQVLGQWDEVAADLLLGMEAHGLTGVIAMGHSFGAVASMIAAIREPARFRALILLDPTFLLPHLLEGLAQMRTAGSIGEFPLVARAAKRQSRFESYEAAYDYFRGRGAFRDWTDEAVRAYVWHGLRPATDGGVMLRWPSAWEAYYFSTGYAATWEMIPRAAGLMPTLIVRGAVSDTYVPEAAARVQALLPDATHLEVAGHGHLFPQSAPAQAGELVRSWLAQMGL